MTCNDATYDDGDADFQRWYFGGSPPEGDRWPRHAFEDALFGTVPTVDRDAMPSSQDECRHEPSDQFEMA